MKRLALGLFCALLLAGPVAAVLPEEQLADPVLEARAREISQDLRCVVCQNQSIDDSDAPLAADLRAIVRERLTAGDSDEEVMAYIVARYGNFVLLKPPLDGQTLLLWSAPLLVLIPGGLGLILYLRRRGRAGAVEPTPLSAEERRALADILKTGDAP
ncbi:MAG: cytochrome c-type biogenesis protein CcmH [Alphaproteobacteria bacterium]|uniref:cytochrome c-type biogenesis protein n=1 Tax=Brevundimonas sp. TaxID=1871086 RepID=UPI0018400B36|nr:cytochrome c-type biogenesis protein [Brevundimonas sp.]MBU3970223.1 cytochrome c-type biogenesis protein CcmH [Alphaproteobacteria bacterium]MBA3050754.1 cytochrome c-type biogenesis protein CcmH [Brevundimonas sp.]MBU3974880.1 cytochrome c-type biogenesis protein CcmH [Alphaproteobacteria bacterium]MBU4040104.1 cytochrome c-type biogenesis protein CcmH [Alphaproteobacteria bacterium]MBU4138216.1 cytochrome c-type biogenesis protein CcmH [Alphaproteobacteria bacterium]